MAKFSTWGIPYTDACALINELRANGIEANITAGGVAMYPDTEDQVGQMIDICLKYNAIATPGNTLHQDMVLHPEETNKRINDRVRELFGEDFVDIEIWASESDIPSGFVPLEEREWCGSEWAVKCHGNVKADSICQLAYGEGIYIGGIDYPIQRAKKPVTA